MAPSLTKRVKRMDAWETAGPTRHLPLEKILQTDNVRKETGDVTELAESIRAVYDISGGTKYLLEPVHVYRNQDVTTREAHPYVLRYGYRRCAALALLAESGSADWAKKVPALIDEDVVNESAGAGVVYKLVENIQREAMNPMDEAYGIRRLIETSGINQTEAARLLGKSKGWVTQRLNLLETDVTVQAAVQSGTVGPASARELTRVPKASQEKIMREVAAAEEPPSVAQLSERVTQERDALDLSAPGLSHDEKLRLIRERAAARGDAPPELPSTEPVVAESGDAVTKYEKEMRAALDKNDRVRAAFYAGVAQGVGYAGGERKRIVFPNSLTDE